MTQIGTFWEGCILVVLGIVMTVIGSIFKVDFGQNATLLITLGVGYIGGGAAGKVEQMNSPTIPIGVKL
jgi:galactitol-specific phosphotransferase system IIC component